MPLLEESVRLSEDLGVRAYAARWMIHLGEGLLAGNDQEQAATTARRALDLARGHDEAGHEALALRLLGETAARRTAPDRDDAATHYGRALELAERLGMRPLLARTHLDLGRVERAAGRLAEAEEHLARAVVLFSALGMRAALERSAPELSALGRLLVVSRGHVPLYEYLSRGHASDPAPRVVLDRRRAEAAAAPPSDRRRRSVDDKLRTRGVAVVTE
jgi:tetratricopeptide (TPR) repeat protein